MTPKNPVEPEGDDSLGVLDDTPSSDTTGIGLHGGTAQVNVALPTGADDDDLVDDEIVDGEINPTEVVSDLILDTSAVADAHTLARIEQEAPDIVIELPAEQIAPAPAAAAESDTGTIEAVAQEDGVSDAGDGDTGEIVVDTEDIDADGDGDAGGDAARDADADAGADADADGETDADADEADVPDLERDAVVVGKPEETDAEETDAEETGAEEPATAGAAADPEVGDREAEPMEPVHGETGEVDAEVPDTEPGDAEQSDTEAADADVEDPAVAAPGAAADDLPAGTPDDSGGDRHGAGELDTSELAHLESVVAAAKAQLRDAMSPAPKKQNEVRPRAVEPAEETSPVANEQRVPASRPAAPPARMHEEEPRTAPEVALTSKRLGDLGAASRESADLLTADRLLEPSRVAKPEPEGTWSHLLYAISGGRINVGDSRKARARKELNARIAAPMPGTARFVPVLSRKGGVGKTTVTALLGMALADARDDRVIAVDANPDRGTLAERVVGAHSKSVRDMVRAQHEIRGFHDISALVARDETRLDVLASDADPRVSEAFGDEDYRDVAAVAAQYYSLVLTDSGTGIVHAVMGATLDLADQIVIVSGLSVDEARLASETLTWLETNGYAELARRAIVVLNQSTPGAPLVRLGELESHFSTRAAHVLRIPYDTQIAGGGAIDFASLQPATRQAAREIAAILVEGLRAQAA